MHSLTKTMILAGALFASSTASAAEPAEIPDSDKSDYLIVYGRHAEPKPNDPVAVRFDKIKVTKVKFAKPDKKNLEGATAQFEVDLTSLKTDSDKRDAHLKSPDYIDVAKFGTLTVDVSKPRADKNGGYRASAKVAFRGKTYSWPVMFKVVETLPDGVRVRGEHKLTRKDVGVGKEAGDGVAQDLVVRVQLTLKSAAK